MTTSKEHIDKIQAWLDLIVAELKKMGKDGHFDEYQANIQSGAVRYELSKLQESVNKNLDSNESKDDLPTL